MRILFASPEAVPFAKTGGLGDVAGALPRALAKLGAEVFLILPKYRQVEEKKFSLKKTGQVVKVPLGGKTEAGEIWTTELAPNCQVLLVQQDKYYDRDYLYTTPSGDYEDNAERFIFFSRAILEAALVLEIKPDVIQCNDWQTGLTPVYRRTIYKGLAALNNTITAFTIHNLAYQGLFWHYDMPMTNLGWELFTPQALEFYGKINFLKGGIVFADAVITVSRKYKEEIQTPEFGCGLEGVLRDRQADLYGILNGVDYSEWSPEIDPYIKEKYSPSALAGKKICKIDLQREFGLPVSAEIPLLATISRLTDQKGCDLLAATMEEMVQMNLQFVILGTGDEKYHFLFQDLQAKYPRQIGLKIGFDNALAHKIEAGADILVMPSRFEPCGLNQIYSLRYGTVPIVRATGGLDDTIVNFNPENGEGNGFKFHEYSAGALLETIKKALQVFQNKDLWQKLMRRGMAEDFSWDRSAQEYLTVYEKTMAKKKFYKI
jgi:starch synthase